MAKVKGKSISKSGKEFNQAEVNRQAKALAENFALIGDQLLDEIGVGVKKAGILVQGRAKKKCPVDTGLLRNSISERTQREDGDTVISEVGTNVEYAPNVEFGTSKQKAQPYLEPALKESRVDINRIVRQAMKDAL
jgi:HK97 gp10 family phage protein